MADTVTLKRIIDLVTQADIDSGVYTIIDSTTDAVKKYPIGAFINSVAPVFDATAAYTAGQYCNYNGQVYKFTADHAAGDWTGSDAEEATLAEALEGLEEIPAEITSILADLDEKADKDGTYPYLTAGLAEQLLSDVEVVDQVPYFFRPSGGDGANREYDQIVGASVVLNQSMPIPDSDISKTQNGVTFVDNRDGSYSVSTESGGASAQTSMSLVNATSIKANRVYLITGVPTGGSGDTYFIYASPVGAIGDSGKLYKNASDTSFTLGIYVKLGVEITTAKVFKPQVIDLTALFGSSAIADYLYTLESGTAGAGIAKLREWGFLQDDYIPYSAPSLQSVSGVSAHVMVGFNQWDEESVLGYWDKTSGTFVSNANWGACKNYIPCVPDAEYYAKCNASLTATSLQILFYDADKNYIGWVGESVKNATFTTPKNARYMTFYADKLYIDYPICINLSNPSLNGQYKPYEKTTYPLDSDLTLRGIFKLDAGNNLYADGDVYSSDGTVTRNYGTRAYASGDESLTDAITDGTTTVYKLTTPTTESADPYQNPQILDPNGTEEYVSTGVVPVGHNTRYPANLRQQVENLLGIPKPPSTAGTYKLQATVSASGVSYAWVSDT